MVVSARDGDAGGCYVFFFSSRRRHTRFTSDWSSDVCSSDLAFLQETLSNAVKLSFNQIDVDGDQSTNDTVVIFANGASSTSIINNESEGSDAFLEALNYVCTELAKELARDGEGAQRLIEVTVDGAATLKEARTASREIVSSLLVKAMVHGRDPNWGRIVMALGKSGIDMNERDLDIFISDIHVVHQGVAIPYYKDAVVSAMSGNVVNFQISSPLSAVLQQLPSCLHHHHLQDCRGSCDRHP